MVSIKPHQFDFPAGWKVVIRGYEAAGFAEVTSPPDEQGHVEVRFYRDPINFESRHVPTRNLFREAPIPAQTRCYYRNDTSFLAGRILVAREVGGPSTPRTYVVQFPNQVLQDLSEERFHVRSNLGDADPVTVLAALAQEGPFLFELRSRWIAAHTALYRACGGLTGLLSARIHLLPHQVEVVRRVLQDPVMRYLLADEVGLGKTIEAGVIIRQLLLDWPTARVAVYVPEGLELQWSEELRGRMGLDVAIRAHSDLLQPASPLDLAVIDEAHKVLAPRGASADQKRLAIAARTLASRTRHLLLLSATPVRRHEEELLQLLHLLAPADYDPDDLDTFRARLTLREPVGRALLALSAAKRPASIVRHITQLATALPADHVVQRAAAAARELEASQQEEPLRKVATDLRVHLTESYRLYRRLLRTRRRLLRELALKSGAPLPSRLVRGVAYEDDPRLPRLWAFLDDWRTQLAADTARASSESRQAAIDAYFELAWALITDRDHLLHLVQHRLNNPRTSPAEHQPLRDLATLGQAPGRTRLDSFRLVLSRLRRESPHDKHVLFLDSSSQSQNLAAILRHEGISDVVVVHRLLTSAQVASLLGAFHGESERRFLIADQSLEEGRNFQAADALTFLDLPFEPMRLEQRLGRLDRIPRTRDVNCYLLLTCEDPDLALDAAWYRLLVDGFGLLAESTEALSARLEQDELFNQSLADLQLLVQDKMPALRALAFQEGPGALVREADNLQRRLREEREALDEQDAIDGLYLGDLTATPLWRSLCAAESDAAAADFRTQVGRYWHDFLGLKTRPDPQNPRVVTYTYDPHRSPLLPLARLQRFSGVVNRPTTVHRPLAVARPDLEFLRPGHAFVDELRTLADWEDRGRVFAMWRQLPGLTEPQLVFRVQVLSGLELPRLDRHLDSTGLDNLGRASLLRLVNSWFPPRLDDVLLNESGGPVDADLQAICRNPYREDVDAGLTGPRAKVLADLVGASAWPEICRRMAKQAEAAVRNCVTFQQDRQQAAEAATEHFRTTLARLGLRRGRAAESDAALGRALRAEERLRDLVLGLIAEPCLRIDSMGVYVLSDGRPASLSAKRPTEVT